MATRLQSRLPNLLTLLRLALAAAFFGILNVYRFPDTAVAWANISVAIFILAAITDALDGALARRWDVQSDFGRVMDPFCDKVLVLGAFIYLAGPRFIVPEWVEAGSFFTMASAVYPWMVVVIIARELLVTGIRGVMEAQGHACPSRWSGKAKMILQSVAIPLLIVIVVNFDPVAHGWVRWVSHVIVYTTVAVTIWSGIPYIMGMRTYMSQRKTPE
jgi:CDP-diacylglycerol--glycerol-3-phosphate 3-phosphatidyltransferase